jgi:hypothetical protein
MSGQTVTGFAAGRHEADGRDLRGLCQEEGAMRIVQRATVVFVSVLFLATGTASAAELFGGPLEVGTGAKLTCQITNIGTRTVEGDIEIFDSDGAIHGPVGFTLGPRKSVGITAVGVAGSWPRTCKFSGSFSRSKVRATASVVDAADNVTAAVEAH